MDDPTDPRITLTLKLSQFHHIVLVLKMLFKFAVNSGQTNEAYDVDDIMRVVQSKMDDAVRRTH